MNTQQPHLAPPHGDAAVPPPLAAGWYPGPLDMRLRRYFDGDRWTFWTARPTTPDIGTSSISSSIAIPAAVAPPAGPSPTPVQQPGLRPDIAAAKKQAKLTLGAEKEVRLLEALLRNEETVLAHCGATGDGVGVLACTNQRLLFYFSGLVCHHFLEVDWNAARHVVYDQRSKRLMVYTVSADAVRVARAAEAASAAPRLDIA